MPTVQLLDLLTYFEAGETLVAIILLLRSKQGSKYWPLIVFLSIRVGTFVCLFPLMRIGGYQISRKLAYDLYFYIYWSSFAAESLFALLTIYVIYRFAMAPLPGLQTLGLLMFRWATAISLALALGITFGPRVTTADYLVATVSQLQRGSSILTLCLLLFVCFAIRPMGLSFRSRIFGVSLGLGMLATINMVQSAWLTSNLKLYTEYSVINGAAICFTGFVWIYYFTVAEPKRKFILLPTTSPFLRWNQISLALGHDPGYVAVGGVAPDAFAPAELEIMKRASIKMKELTDSGVTPEMERQRYPHTYIEEAPALRKP